MNASCYEPTSATQSGEGGAPTNRASGAEGAGNVEKTGEPEASLRCLPELVMAAKDCGSAFLVRSLTSALVCGVRLEALRECLSEPAKK